MHELAITQGIVRMVDEAALGRVVRRITVEIGVRSGVSSEAIAFCFPLVADGTAAQGAQLDIRLVPARGVCDDCGAEAESTEAHGACVCGSRRVVWKSGDDMRVKNIEVEEAA